VCRKVLGCSLSVLVVGMMLMSLVFVFSMWLRVVWLVFFWCGLVRMVDIVLVRVFLLSGGC